MNLLALHTHTNNINFHSIRDFITEKWPACARLPEVILWNFQINNRTLIRTYCYDTVTAQHNTTQQFDANELRALVRLILRCVLRYMCNKYPMDFDHFYVAWYFAMWMSFTFGNLTYVSHVSALLLISHCMVVMDINFDIWISSQMKNFRTFDSFFQF